MPSYFVGWRAVVEACEEITSFEVGVFPYEILLFPALASKLLRFRVPNCS